MTRPTAKAQPAESGNDVEHRLVGGVVADEDRMPTGERRVPHQGVDRVAFVDAGGFDLEHELARQDVDGMVRLPRADAFDGRLQRRPQMRRKAVMQRQRITLVLDQNTGPEFAQGRKRALQFGAE